MSEDHRDERKHVVQTSYRGSGFRLRPLFFNHYCRITVVYGACVRGFTGRRQSNDNEDVFGRIAINSRAKYQ